MTDSSGNGNHGVIDPTGVVTGYVVGGATGYHWVRRPPEQYPASPERVIQVADDIDLEPGDQPFTIEIRYRTKEKFGNITQKGQATTRGGQWKIQNPQGIPSCLFKGSRGRVATGAKTPLNDNLWHTLTCVLTSSSVTMYVDGVFRNRKNGATGTKGAQPAGTHRERAQRPPSPPVAHAVDHFSGRLGLDCPRTSGPLDRPAHGRPGALTAAGLAHRAPRAGERRRRARHEPRGLQPDAAALDSQGQGLDGQRDDRSGAAALDVRPPSKEHQSRTVDRRGSCRLRHRRVQPMVALQRPGMAQPRTEAGRSAAVDRRTADRYQRVRLPRLPAKADRSRRWMVDALRYGKQHNVVAMAYFNSANSRHESWVLRAGRLRAFRKNLGRESVARISRR